MTQIINTKKYIILLILFMFLSVVFLPMTSVLAAQDTAPTGAPVEYIPLSSITPDGTIDTTDPGTYLNNMFGIAIGVAGILAVIMLMICGWRYIISDATSGKEGAKKQCWAAIIGIFILLISWIGLNTISPDLVGLTFDQLRTRIQDNTGPGNQPPAPPPAQPFCYVNESGTNSYPNQAACDVARDADIISNPQISFLEQQNSAPCAILIPPASSPQYCYLKYTVDPNSVTKVCTPLNFSGNVLAECNKGLQAAKDAANTKQDALANSYSACSSNPSC